MTTLTASIGDGADVLLAEVSQDGCLTLTRGAASIEVRACELRALLPLLRADARMRDFVAEVEAAGERGQR